MTQDAFIEQLRHELRSLPKHVVDEIVADYREYIGDALAAGRSEPEVVAALGDPAKLARELRAQANFRQWETRRSFGNLMRVFASIAGLGLLQLLLLVPFMFYLLLLTAAYTLSAGLFAAGLAIVLILGSHHLFGWPSADFIPFSIEAGSDDGKTGAKAAAGRDVDEDDDDDDEKSAAASAPQAPPAPEAPKVSQAGTAAASTEALLAHLNVPDLRVDGERFVLRPQAGTHVSIVTTAGPLELNNRDGKLRVEAVGGSRALFTVEGESWSIRRVDVVALELRNKQGDKVSAARVGGKPESMAWDIRDRDASMSFVEGDQPHLSLKSGEDSIEIDRNHVALGSGKDRLVIVGSHGERIGTLLYGFAMLIGGLLGLWLCLLLTRATWRGLVRYVRRQAERITERLDTGAA
ncbi:DUF1700 domain-containing protein [Burkholderia gladioli]|uniref:DUF1700 domain-containing protein n=1 Tax=Burkholderia gladioli TaxID=28095 RepID=UPI00236448BD|nr:DUF1700 domain-containing protein [Burkholderia gladioli]MDD1788946.1 DUF1700 domain-containing protein [Burkholderia gladioli]